MVSNVELQQQIKSLATTVGNIATSIEGLKQSVEERLTSVESKINTVVKANEVLKQTVDENNASSTQAIERLTMRMAVLEEKVRNYESLPDKVIDLQEKLEDRTNRQLRETLVFRNIPETSPEENYAQTKELLAKHISEHTDIPLEEIKQQIKRAHREAPKRNDDGKNTRKGKRHIFAAFHSWELCQSILEKFRLKSIKDSTFNFYADQKYGTLTTRRRNLALGIRKDLKASGKITAGYLQFPAKLLVNYNGDVNVFGKKIYVVYKDYSKHEIE